MSRTQESDKSFVDRLLKLQKDHNQLEFAIMECIATTGSVPSISKGSTSNSFKIITCRHKEIFTSERTDLESLIKEYQNWFCKIKSKK